MPRFAFLQVCKISLVRSPFERYLDDRSTRGEKYGGGDGRGSDSACPVVVRAKRREVSASR